MTTDPDRPAVPGLEPSDGRPSPRDLPAEPSFDPAEHPRLVEPAPAPRRRLGAADDPDRFDPDRAQEAPSSAEPTRALDPRQDPDRFLPPGQGQTLTDLLGKSGSHEGERNGYEWIAGLVGVLAFLALVAYLFTNVLTP